MSNEKVFGLIFFVVLKGGTCSNVEMSMHSWLGKRFEWLHFMLVEETSDIHPSRTEAGNLFFLILFPNTNGVPWVQKAHSLFERNVETTVDTFCPVPPFCH
jgi:hypothetical protein